MTTDFDFGAVEQMCYVQIDESFAIWSLTTNE